MVSPSTVPVLTSLIFCSACRSRPAAQFGENNYHFRGNSWDLYAQDEWKMRGNLTLNLGVRYEYVSPYTEINNRIVNLDLSPGVLSLSGWNSSRSCRIARPSRALQRTLPRHAGAARPQQLRTARWFCLETFFQDRGARRLRHQLQHWRVPEVSFSNSRSSRRFLLPRPTYSRAPDSSPCRMGFRPPNPAGITNNYAVNPNYRLGYVQIRNLDIQQQIKPTLLLNIDYTGTKGTDLDILEAPNRTATGIRIPGVQAFTYQNSVADSEANAGSVRLRKRLSQGFSVGGTYTFSKSLDDASTIGAGATSGSGSAGLGAGGTAAGGGASSGTSSAGTTNVAQNAFDLSAERGLSSFNQTHRFTADYLWELPFGHDKRWLTGNSVPRAIFGDWQWSGDWTIASGLPFTPRLLGDFSDVQRGTNGTLRPNLVPRRIDFDSEPVDWAVVQYCRIRRTAGGSIRRCSPQQHHRSSDQGF